ncbi:DNA methyltransferase [Candidatus Hodarchaeum mangrovi]
MESDLDLSNLIFYFLLSGENPELAEFEFQTVFNVLAKGQFKEYAINIFSDKRIIELTLSINTRQIDAQKIVEDLLDRLTQVHVCFKRSLNLDFIKYGIKSYSDLYRQVHKSNIYIQNPEKSFGIIIKRIGIPKGFLKDKSITLELSRNLGAKIQALYPQKKVNLRNPDEKFLGIISEYGFWFGVLIGSSLRKEVRKRTAHTRPFFHPSSMNPILLRTMINLAALKSNDLMLDPFCGSGGGVMEAARMGIRSIGIEIDKRIVWGAFQNLKFFEYSKITSLIHGDALNICISKGSISGVVTDPPYGTAASTKGISLSKLIIRFFKEISPILSSNQRVVLAIPANLEIEEQASEILHASVYIFYQYVHRSLTRKILVFVKK